METQKSPVPMDDLPDNERLENGMKRENSGNIRYKIKTYTVKVKGSTFWGSLDHH